MTLEDLMAMYLVDADSPFHKKRHVTKEGYRRLLLRLKADLGDRDLASLKVREIKHQHDAWVAGGKVAMGHSLMTMLRCVISFGASLLEDEDCQRIKGLLSGMRFENSAPRTTWLTASQAEDVRDFATLNLYYAVALAQAFQQDCALRQKDVIGEWVPLDDPTPSTIINGQEKWVRGITREEIEGDEDNLVLRHVTSKKGKPQEFKLNLCPSVMEEWFAAPPSGPLIIDPQTRLPYEGWKFRRIWRRMAGLAGIPKDVWNMDSRAGRITGVLASGATLEDARKLAGHTNQITTARYSRGGAEAIERVLRKAKEDRDAHDETPQEAAKRKWAADQFGGKYEDGDNDD